MSCEPHELSPDSFAFNPWTVKFVLATGFSCIVGILGGKQFLFLGYSASRADNLFLPPGNLLVEGVFSLMINR